MPFVKNIPFNTTGPSYQHRSKPLSSQQTVNLYQQYNEAGKVKYTLQSFPALSQLGQSSEGEIDRGFNVMVEILYQVKGDKLYSIDRVGNHTELGTIPGNERCVMANDGVNIFIVSDLKVWQWDGVSVTEVTNEYITGAKSVAFINNFFLYTFDKFTTVSNAGDGSEATDQNIIGAESQPDGLVRDYAYDGIIYRMGDRTIESWYVSGQGEPPIDRVEGRGFPVGLAGVHAVTNTDKALYWLGDDWAVYRARAGNEERISTDAISQEIQTYNTTSDCILQEFTLDGQNFVSVNFPSQGKTFVVNEELGKNGWFELSSGTDGGNYQGVSFARAYNKNLVADVVNGKVYELRFDVFENDGMPIRRRRVTDTINGDLLGKKGVRIQMSEIKFIMEVGVGTISGQGEVPRIQIEFSDDGGRTWKHSEWVRIGRLGENTLQVYAYNLDTFYDRMVRITMTDPVVLSLYEATVDLRLAGR